MEEVGNGEYQEVTYLGNQESEAENDFTNLINLQSESDVIKKWNMTRATTQYRNTTIGKTLEEALQDLHAGDKMPAGLCSKVLCQFDRTIVRSFSQVLTGRVVLAFKSSKLKKYKFFDDVWRFDMENTEFRGAQNCLVNVPRMRIIAFNKTSPVIMASKKSDDGKQQIEKNGGH